MSDHYLMSEHNNTQKLKSCSDIVIHTKKNLLFTEWNDGMSEWYPNNPYPPLKCYIKSVKNLRTKQGIHYEFDEALGFHLPTNRLNGSRKQEQLRDKVKNNTVNNGRPP